MQGIVLPKESWRRASERVMRRSCKSYSHSRCPLIAAFVFGAVCASISTIFLFDCTCRCDTGLSILSETAHAKAPVAEVNTKDGLQKDVASITAGAPMGAGDGLVRSWLQAQFEQMDIDKDGKLDHSDVLMVSKHMNLSTGYASKLSSMVGNREVSLQELAALKGWIHMQFLMMDADADGSLDSEDLARISRKIKLSPSYASKLHKKVGDRELSFAEFKSIIKHMEDVSKGGKAATVTSSHSEGIFEESINRAALLMGLMMLQSASAMVLGRYESLLKEHVIVMLFLTMLVGAGGNVGNQSVIKVLELLISGEIHATWKESWYILEQQAAVGIVLALMLGIAGFARALATQYCFRDAGGDKAAIMLGCIAVAISLMVIVFTSAILGTLIPLVLAVGGFDVGHAGPTIQVVMDIGGVVITCSLARAILRHSKT